MNAPTSDRTLRPVAIVGGLRTPFCRSNTAYGDVSNRKMLTTVLEGMVDRWALDGERLGEVNAGAVITHSRDWNLAREAVLGTSLDPRTPALTLQQACGTSLQAALVAGAKIATGQIDSAIAAGTDTVSDVPIVFSTRFAKRLVALGKAKSVSARLAVFKGFGPKELAPLPALGRRAAHAPEHGPALRADGEALGASRARRRTALAVASHPQRGGPPTSAASSTICSWPCEGGAPRQQPPPRHERRGARRAEDGVRQVRQPGRSPPATARP